MIRTALSLIDYHEYRDAKLAWLLTMPAVKNRVIDLSGNEGEYFLKIIQPFLATAVTTWCSLPSCPSMTSTYLSQSKTTLLMHPFKNGSIQGRVNARENLQTSPQVVYLVTQIQLFVMMVHSSGVRSLPCLFLSFTFLLFSVELINRNTNLDIKNLPQVTTLHRAILHLRSATI